MQHHSRGNRFKSPKIALPTLGAKIDPAFLIPPKSWVAFWPYVPAGFFSPNTAPCRKGSKLVTCGGPC